MESKLSENASPVGINMAIIEALQAIIRDKHNSAEAARHLGVNQSQLNRWLGGETKWMTPKVWQRLEPFLRPYLPSSDMSPKQISGTSPAGIPVAEKQAPSGKVENEGRIMSWDEFVAMPVVGIAHAAEWDSTLQTFSEFADAHAVEYIPVPRDQADGCGAIKIQGRSMTPYYPDGTVVVFKPGVMPRHGKRVIAKLREEQLVVFKLFYKLHDPPRILLKSINDNGKDFVFSTHPKDNPFEWIHVIKMTVRNEDDLDDELHAENLIKDRSADYNSKID